ncbi:hypothetical protein BH24PSE2_BH24PSE2_01810 [soil metagenome]
MRIDRLIRILISLLVVLALLAVVATALFVTESAFAVWDRLRAAPRWLFFFYVSSIVAAVLASGWIIWRLLRPPRRRGAASSEARVSEPELHDRLTAAEAAGLDVDEVRREIHALGQRRSAGRVYVALFGEISTGKSALIGALVPDAAPEIDVRGGSTRFVRHYQWQSPAGDELALADVPGVHGMDGQLGVAAREEALRAHVVVYVCDSDLTREQLQELETLLALDKPLVLALNKSDRYSTSELHALKERLARRLTESTGNPEAVEIVAVSAGGVERAVTVAPDGTERVIERSREPDVAPLLAALQRRLDEDTGALETLRDSAVFLLAARKLDAVEAAYRCHKARGLVKSYTRKAVVGALAAVTPGTDVLIQGFLGTSLVRELCSLYRVAARDLDIQEFLNLSQSKAGRAFPILLAVAGNGFKAFPGGGTVAGGLMHAVAYGLIFDALGASLIDTLETRGRLEITPAAEQFEHNLQADLSGRARALARLALRARDDGDGGS